MPGAGFKRMAAVCAQRCQEMLDRPMKAVQDMQVRKTNYLFSLSLNDTSFRLQAQPSVA